MTDVLCLDTLPCDVLFKIFDYCHAFDLVRLSKVCRRFYDIVNKNILWIRRSKQPLVTNQVSERFLKRFVRLFLQTNTILFFHKGIYRF